MKNRGTEKCDGLSQAPEQTLGPFESNSKDSWDDNGLCLERQGFKPCLCHLGMCDALRTFLFLGRGSGNVLLNVR